MVEFSKNKWMYSTIGLLAVLAIAFSFPQAFAHITTNTQHGLVHVVDLLTGIDRKVTDLDTKVDALTRTMNFDIELSPSNDAETVLAVNEELEPYTKLGATLSISVSGLSADELLLICGVSEDPNLPAAVHISIDNGDHTIDAACSYFVFRLDPIGKGPPEDTVNIHGNIIYDVDAS